jgi:YHS domain-containing protein
MKIAHVCLIVVTSLISTFVISQGAENSLKQVNTKKGVAISGYDPVSYFQEGPAEGNSKISFKYKGAKYYFSTQENLELFKTNPEMYVPAYGGWCAYAIAEDGSKVKIDPNTYLIQNGKLLLFYNQGKLNTLNFWKEDEDGYLEKAEKNWLEIVRKK